MRVQQFSENTCDFFCGMRHAEFIYVCDNFVSYMYMHVLYIVIQIKRPLTLSRCLCIRYTGVRGSRLWIHSVSQSVCLSVCFFLVCV